MDILVLTCAGILASVGNPLAATTGIARWAPLVAEAAQRYDLPVDWINSVMAAESRGALCFKGAPITSPAGAMGLMQIMPATYAYLRARYSLGSDSFDPQNNIFAGTAYLRELYVKYGYPNMFAAYNAGPARVDDLLARGRQLPADTMAYLYKVTRGAHGSRSASDAIMVSATKPTTKKGLFFFNSSVSRSPNVGNDGSGLIFK